MGLCAVFWLLMTAAWAPHLGWKVNFSPSSSSGKFTDCRVTFKQDLNGADQYMRARACVCVDMSFLALHAQMHAILQEKCVCAWSCFVVVVVGFVCVCVCVCVWVRSTQRFFRKENSHQLSSSSNTSILSFLAWFKDLFLMLRWLSATVSLAKLSHQMHSHISDHLGDLTSSSYPIDFVRVCVCVHVCLCVCMHVRMHVCSRNFDCFGSSLCNGPCAQFGEIAHKSTLKWILLFPNKM